MIKVNVIDTDARGVKFDKQIELQVAPRTGEFIEIGNKDYQIRKIRHSETSISLFVDEVVDPRYFWND